MIVKCATTLQHPDLFVASVFKNVGDNERTHNDFSLFF